MKQIDEAEFQLDEEDEIKEKDIVDAVDIGIGDNGDIGEAEESDADDIGEAEKNDTDDNGEDGNNERFAGMLLEEQYEVEKLDLGERTECEYCKAKLWNHEKRYKTFCCDKGKKYFEIPRKFHIDDNR